MTNLEPLGPVAAIDCGTNSTRLLVVDGDGHTLERLMRITRLGQGVDATHRLQATAIERTVGVLGEFRDVMVGLGVVRGRLVATSAARDATNGDEFLEAATRATGFRAELLDGQAEGRLAYAGATVGLEPGPGDDVVVDIGGGSTELVVARGGQVQAVSINMGCVRLSERYLRCDPPTADELAAAAEVVDGQLDLALQTFAPLAALRPTSRLVGLAGTVSTVGALELDLHTYDRDRLHHSVISAVRVAHWLKVLAQETAARRAERAAMDPGREDVIVGGVLILQRVMQRLGFDQCLVSESDILDGLAASQLGESLS